MRLLLAPGERPLGHLILEHRHTQTRAALGPAAATRGLLLGRYARCELPGLDETVSRVHALVIHEGGALHLIDAGSSNGTWRAEERLTCAPLTTETSFRLGCNLHVSWESAA